MIHDRVVFFPLLTPLTYVFFHLMQSIISPTVLCTLIAVSSPDLITKYGQFTADAFLYHDLVYLLYRVRVVIFLQHNFGAVDRNRLWEDECRVNWLVVVQY